MSDADLEQRHKAREMMAAACAAWIDQWDWTAGSIVTGYVLVMETTRPSGGIDCTFATGNGAGVRDEDLAGLPAHRVEGLVRSVIRSLDRGDVEND